ncbi:MAG: aminomethyl-transferring glycine dehydrogenase [Bdellovibrionales bacterium]
MNSFSSHFMERHIGPRPEDLSEILKALKLDSLEDLIQSTIPAEIYQKDTFNLSPALSEPDLLEKIKKIGEKNKLFKNYIGMGYNPCFTPGVIARNILENPTWYTSYTPYQSEISQGRLEALLNFQTMIADLTGMDLANASLLDEGTAAAEAVVLSKNANEKKQESSTFFVDQYLFPQTLDVLKTRSQSLNLKMKIGDFKSFKDDSNCFAALIQYPNSLGSIENIQDFIQDLKKRNIFSIVITDPLSLTLLIPPGEMGADVVVGSSQRLGLPLFFGGPHSAYFATREKYARFIPGRIVGVSKDRHNQVALRLALQVREQHIKRERATSNICTSQVLLALTSSFYGVYHGPKGLKKIASKINTLTKKLYEILSNHEGEIKNETFFDTLSWELNNKEKSQKIEELFWKEQINIGRLSPTCLSWTLNETTQEKDLLKIESLLKKQKTSSKTHRAIPKNLQRTSKYLTHPVFNSYHSETKLLRYIHSLQKKELSLTHSMIPLGSCTMKLNSVTEMQSLLWPCFSDLHPFAPKDQSQGYKILIEELEQQLCELTGFDQFSFQPNAGSQGEYAGLLAIQACHKHKKQTHRNICLIPTSAHGTNPASAIMAGLKVVPVACTKEGPIDIKDLDEKLKIYGNQLSCIMITYPSTYGFFEEGMKDICSKIHKKGGLVYLDGANMNALLGLCKPRNIGFDVCHLNLHKTFCIPHGGGGPGVGPIGVTEELKNFLPSHWNFKTDSSLGAISSSPYGSAGILSISWAYISLMSHEGLKKSAQVAIANANYIAEKLQPFYKVLFKGKNNRVAHECIIDFRKFKNTAGITVDDISKRLIDYSFHAPTMSWPVPGTLMIEPTESESKEELDRFCDALISIRKEIKKTEKDSQFPLLKNAPHTLEDLMKDDWNFPYSKKEAFYPVDWVKKRKFWTPVSRIENAYGDIHLSCSCPSMKDFEKL